MTIPTSNSRFQKFDLHTMKELRGRYPGAAARSLRLVWWLPVVHMLALVGTVMTLGCFLTALMADQVIWLGVALPPFAVVLLSILVLPWLLVPAQRLERQRAEVTQPIVIPWHLIPAQTTYVPMSGRDSTTTRRRDHDLRS